MSAFRTGNDFATGLVNPEQAAVDFFSYSLPPLIVHSWSKCSSSCCLHEACDCWLDHCTGDGLYKEWRVDVKIANRSTVSASRFKALGEARRLFDRKLERRKSRVYYISNDFVQVLRRCAISRTSTYMIWHYSVSYHQHHELDTV